LVNMTDLRVGFGFDIHKFELGVPLILGGVRIEHEYGLVSHTDGDAICHALMDALFTACGLPDIGTHFPPSDPRLRGVSSIDLLRETVHDLSMKHLERILNVTITVMTEQPKIAPYRDKITLSLARTLGIELKRIAVAAGTNERFDAVGRGEALACFANVLVLVKEAGPDARAPAVDDPRLLVPTQSGITDPEAIPADYELPQRVKEFERAVKTKLAPLPKAPPPPPGGELILYTDGASRGNPGPAASGWVIFDAMGSIVHEDGNVLGQLTNNEAEYAALIEALKWVEANLGVEYKLTLRMDSELIVKQLRGEYKIKAEHLRQTALLAMNTLAGFSDLKIEHVPRAQNARADALANRALDNAPKG
jgi:2-C-methyl-D-erythritol 2,4-cyclodiphosphate synthase